MDKRYLALVKERRDSEFWIDTEGRIRKWKGSLKELDNFCSTHYAIGIRLYPKLERPEDYLHELNWISIGSAAYGRRIKSEPTQAQINTLFELGIRRIRDSYGKLYEF
jgi:hypothetical protein